MALRLETGDLVHNRYKILAKIDEGLQSCLYRAEDSVSHQEVALRFLKQENRSYRIEDLIRFKKEIASISQLDHPHLIKIYELAEYGGFTYLSIDYKQGMTLSSYLKQGITLPQKEVLKMISELSGALQLTHDQGIIHRDINPENIWLPIKNGAIVQAQLSGFGFIELKELAEINTPEAIINTFSYMSPEAAGIVNKRVDERSDLYSLGILFYQLLTGELPYKGNNLDTILHMHIAKIPLPPSQINKNITPELDKIILKLLNKDRDDRYQSAQGLISDINKVLAGERGFEPGLEDKSFGLDFNPPLVGRERELALLKEQFDKAYLSRGGICLISGEAGRGKTTLVKELKGYIFEKGGVFLSAKCFAGRDKMPYQIYHEALNEYLNHYQRLDAKTRQETSTRLRAIVGELGEIIIKLNPAMKSILGEINPLVRLEADKENKRFLNLSAKFFCSLGKKKAPLVLFMDDLQWSDQGSFSLLSEIAFEIDGSPLLIIATYRDNEITAEHSLLKLKRQFSKIEELNLNLFNTSQLNSLAAKILGRAEAEIPGKLTGYLLEKSKGNPFFALEVIRQLLDEGAIRPGAKLWEVDIKKLDVIKVPTTIVDIVLRRIKMLNATERDIISYGAIIGSRFDINLLFKLSELNQEQILAMVDKAIELQLLEKSLAEKDKILFAHDRVRDAFYKEIGRERRKSIHLKIAQVLEKEEKTDDLIFSLAHHYGSARDDEKSLAYLIPAGHISKAEYANEEATRYYQSALQILERKGQKHGSVWIEIVENLGEVYLATGKYDQVITRFNQLFPLMETNLKKAAIYKQISSAYFKKGEWEKCEEYGRIGLKLLGERLPVNKKAVIGGALKELVIHVSHNLFPKLFMLSRRKLKNDKYKLILLFYETLNWAYVLSDILKFIKSMLRMLNLAQSKIGKSNELAVSMGGYAGVCLAIPLFRRGISYHEQALAMRKELGDQWGIAESLQFMGYGYEWKGEYKKSLVYFNKAIEQYKRVGDLKGLEMSFGGQLRNYLMLSDYQQATTGIEQRLAIATRSKDNYGISNGLYNKTQYNLELGDFKNAEHYGLKSYQLSRKHQIWFVHCMINIELGILSLEKNDVKKSLEYLEEAKSLYETHNFLKQYTIHLYSQIAEALIAYHVHHRQPDRKQKKSSLQKILAACKTALNKTKPWISHYGAALRVNGKYYALIGKNKRALQLFLQSIELENKIERRYELAKSHYEYGIFLSNIGKDDSARANWQKAYTLFKEISSKIYLQRTADLLGIATGEYTTKDRFLDKRHLSSIITVSQQISSILNIEELLENIVAKALEGTGASRGYLFIADEDSNELRLRASKSTEQQMDKQEGSPYSEELIHTVYASGRSVISDDETMDRAARKYEQPKPQGPRSILCIPVNLRDRTIGVFYLDNRLSRAVFTEEDITLLNVFLSQAAISIENAGLYSNLEKKVEERTGQLKEAVAELEKVNKQLEEKNVELAEVATRDSLTGLLNHASLHERLEEIFDESRRHQFPISIIMIDLDHFKQMNDNYGHQTGDEILKKVAMVLGKRLRAYDIKAKYSEGDSQILKEELRKYDVAGRYGGDEFTVILPYCGEEEAHIVAVRLMDRIAAINLSSQPGLSISSSLGIAILDKDSLCKDSRELIRLADEALYKSKRAGRGRAYYLKCQSEEGSQRDAEIAPLTAQSPDKGEKDASS